ncbi:MAG: NADH-quinone oxidoreductase subunit N [Candidatus Limnocylindria bacterium]|nr:NADH-quinone oxidoreductase subunit N [Candidatus Limnocylindria bacterium]
MTLGDLLAAAPLIVLAGGACLVLAADLVVRLPARGAACLGATVAAVAAVLAARLGPGTAGFGGALERDGGALFFVALVAAGAAGALLIAADYLAREDLPAAEFVALVLFSATGAGLMAAGGDLLVVFLGLELLSLPLYALTGLLARARHADEAALKYFLLGAAASAVFLYGVALVYAATGTIRLDVLARGATPPGPLAFAGFALLLCGIAFKAALVPFHAWAPDVYEAAPPPATAFMALAAKTGAFAALLRIQAATSGGAAMAAMADWRAALAAVAALTIVVGNLAALGQRRVRRLLGWSSVAHAGYLAAAAAAGADIAAPFVAFYLVVYGTLSLASFGLLTLLPDDDPTLDDLGGLFRRSPLVAVGFVVVLVGLTGLPPTAGFLAKLYVFEALAQAHLLWLLIIGVLASVVSAAYYLRVALACFAPPRAEAMPTGGRRLAGFVVALATLLSLALGVAPLPLLELVRQVRY